MLNKVLMVLLVSVSANVSAEFAIDKSLNIEQSGLAAADIGPYADYTVLFDGAYKSVQEVGKGSWVLNGRGDDMPLQQVLPILVPEDFRILVSDMSLLDDVKVSWTSGQELADVLRRAGDLGNLAFIIDWDKKALVVDEGQGVKTHDSLVVSDYEFFIPFVSGATRKVGSDIPLNDAIQSFKRNQELINSVHVVGISKSENPHADIKVLNRLASGRVAHISKRLKVAGVPEGLFVTSTDVAMGVDEGVSGVRVSYSVVVNEQPTKTTLVASNGGWKLLKGKRFSEVFASWSSRSEWDVIWDYPEDVIAAANAEYEGDLPTVIDEVLTSVHKYTGLPIGAEIYKGNKVVRVVHVN